MQPAFTAPSAAGGATARDTDTDQIRLPRTTLGERLARGLTVEHLLYAAIFVIACLTRFWDLGSRALHHDESLHSYFSWVFAEGNGYIHDPLMHGPFLFHATAFMYMLFGTTDAVSRIVPAALGVLTVMLPWLLRGDRLLGRWGALTASALLLISPSILYYSRFIRHDIFLIAGTLVLFIAIVRYLEQPEARWAITGALAIGYMLTTEEVSFIVLFVFATFLGIAIAVKIAPSLLGVAAGAGIVFLVTSRVLHALGAPPLPGIPWDRPTGRQIEHFAVKLFEHPVVIAALGIGLLAIVISLWLLDRKRPPETGWIDGILGDAPEGSTAGALYVILSERRGLWIGLAGAITIFVVLYTTLFTNMAGLASGTFGALGYWLGQQGVQRGQEPWFYYLILLPQYEYVAALIFPFAILLTLWRTVRAWRAGISPDRRTYIRGFLIYWSFGMLAVLSWAGEKMPWIVVHIALPMTLLAAATIGDGIEQLERHWLRWSPGARRDLIAFGGAVIALLGTAFLSLAWASDGPYSAASGVYERTLRAGVTDHWWTFVYLPWLVLLALLALAIVRLGARRALTTVLIAGTLALSLAQVHAEWRLTYREGDVPRDMLIYVQTSPDVPRVTKQLTELSQQVNGGMGLAVWYDDVTQWPFNWYLKDFPNRRYIGNQLPSDLDAQVIIVADNTLTSAMEDQLKENYSYQEYPMRWWYPEENTYRRFAYAPDITDENRQNYQDSSRPPYTLLDVARSVWSSIWSMREPSQQGKIFRMVAYREVPSGFGSVNFRVYVRNDLYPYFNQIRYDR
jgi:uncharacterized protein (TIGR03663 family)